MPIEINSSSLVSDTALKAYYRFESGALTTDSSGEAHTLTAISDPAETTGIAGSGGVILDGNDAYSAVDHADFKPTTSFTMGTWFKTTVTGTQQILLSSMIYSGPSWGGIRIWIDNTNLRFDSARATGYTENTDWKQLTTSSSGYLDGNWHQMIGVWDGSTMYLYIDGVLKNSVAWANAPGYQATNYVRVGCGNNTGTNIAFLTGSMDETFIFNGKALSAAEVNELYYDSPKNGDWSSTKKLTINNSAWSISTNQTNFPVLIKDGNIESAVYSGMNQSRELNSIGLLSDASLRAYYRFNSGALTTDSSGNGYTLTNTNTVGESSSGKFGYSADFGASNQNKKFLIANDMGITNGPITMSAWFQNNGTVINDQYPDIICHVDNGTYVRYSINVTSTGYRFSRNGIGGGGTSGTITWTGTKASGSNWDHLVLTYDGTNVRGYVNGLLVGAAAASGNGAGFSGSYEGVSMGATHGWDGIHDDSSPTFSSISGKIDDVAIFSRGLTFDEVRDLWGYGSDLRFTSDSAGITELPFEIVSLDTVAETAEIWVKHPSVLHNADTEFYMWYGNASAAPYAIDSAYGMNAVWSNYDRVSHLQTSSVDSTSNGINGADTAITYGTTYGKIGGGADFNGSTSQVDYGTSAVMDSSTTMTYQGWVESAAINGTGRFMSRGTGASTRSWDLSGGGMSGTAARLYVYIRGNSSSHVEFQSSTDLSNDTKYLVHVTYNGSVATIIVNGTSHGTQSVSMTPLTGSYNTYLGRRWDGLRLNGSVDEFRFTNNVAVSVDWAATEYANQNSPSTFLTMSDLSTDDSDERDAAITGQVLDDSSRSSRIVGQDSSASQRSSKVTGQDSSNSERDSKLIGQDTSSSSRNAKLVGGASENDERFAKITGVDTSNSTRSASIYGGYVTPQYLYWDKINTDTKNVLTVIVYEVDVTTPSDSSIDWHASPNGGSNWEAITAGTEHTFSNSGNDLRLRATLNASSDIKSSPTLTEISTIWTEQQSVNTNDERNSKLIGQDTDSDSRTAKTTGQDTSSSSRSATTYGVDTSFNERDSKITGQDISNSNRLAKTTGQDSNNNTRDAKISGSDTATDQRSSKVIGKDTNNDDRSVKITGQSASNSERNAKATGQDIESSERSTKVVGQDTSSSEKSARLLGQDATNNNRSAKITGQNTSTAERSAKVTGQVLDNDERSSSLYGVDTDNSTKSAKVTGQDTDSDTRSVKLTGVNTDNSERNSKVVGQDTSNNQRSAKIIGEDQEVSQKAATLYGVDTENSSRQSKVVGELTSSDERSSKLIGQDVSSSERSSTITGSVQENDERSAKLSGTDTTFSQISSKTIGQDSDNDLRSAKVTGINGANETRSVKLVGEDTNSDQRLAVIDGTLAVSDQVLAKVTGKDVNSSERDAKIAGQVLDNSERSSTLLGQESDSSSRSLKIVGQENIQDQKLAKIIGQDTSSSSRDSKIVGHVLDSDQRSVKVSGKDTDQDERGSRVTGSQGSSSEREAKLSGQDTSSSSRSSKLTGLNVESNQRSAKIEGVYSDNNERLAKVSGTDTTNSRRLASIRGAFGTIQIVDVDTGVGDLGSIFDVEVSAEGIIQIKQVTESGKVFSVNIES